MTIDVTTTPYGAAAHEALAAAIDAHKATNRLAPVSVIVSSNQVGIAARRALGRRGGVAGHGVRGRRWQLGFLGRLHQGLHDEEQSGGQDEKQKRHGKGWTHAQLLKRPRLMRRAIRKVVRALTDRFFPEEAFIHEIPGPNPDIEGRAGDHVVEEIAIQVAQRGQRTAEHVTIDQCRPVPLPIGSGSCW